jgi:hypothetical protein
MSFILSAFNVVPTSYLLAQKIQPLWDATGTLKEKKRFVLYSCFQPPKAAAQAAASGFSNMKPEPWDGWVSAASATDGSAWLASGFGPKLAHHYA